MKQCLNCDNPVKRKTSKYCSNQCQKDYEHKTLVDNWLAGNDEGWKGKSVQLKNFIRKWLHNTRGTACEECSWDGKHPVDGLPLTEVDHIDGNPKNNKPENLKILCPNCHAMTPTFRRRNKNSPRNR